MSPIHTRVATLADLDAVALLFDAYRQFYQQTPAVDMARRFIGERLQHNESVILVASNDSLDIIGFCQLYPSFCSIEARPIFVLNDLFVTPQTRGTGAGKALLQAAEVLATERGKARMDLTTARTNKLAQTAYESQGWVRDEVYYAYSKTMCGG